MKRLVILAVVAAITGPSLQACNASASPRETAAQLVLAGSPPFYAKDSWTITNNLATNVAALTASSGIPLDNCKGLSGVAAADAGATISSGNFRGYVYVPVAAAYPSAVASAWVPYAALDWTPATGNRYAVTGDKLVLSGVGRFAWVEDDIALSANSIVDVIYAVRPAP